MKWVVLLHCLYILQISDAFTVDSRALKDFLLGRHNWWPFKKSNENIIPQFQKRKWSISRQANPVVSLSRSATATIRSSNHDWICLGIANGFRCANCAVSVMCVGGQAYLQACPERTACTLDSDFTDAVCHASIPRDCFCKRNMVQPDPYSPYAYHICDTAGNQPARIHICPPGSLFDEETSSCEPKPEFPECNALGTFPNENQCEWYYSCHLNGGGSWTQVHRRCSLPGFSYSSSRGVCMNANKMDPSEPCSKKSNRKSRYVCSLWGLLVAKVFPKFIHKLCYEYN